MADVNHEIDEASRLAALHAYEVLDTPDEPVFDDFTHLAAEICDVPISLISLVDDRRQWFKSKVGLDANETPRESAFCAHALATPDEVLIVRDASEDARFANNPLVTREPYIRFYTGAPLVTDDGHVLGTLCVIDRQPRALSEKQINSLKVLARQVISQLEARRNLQLLEESTKKLEQEHSDLQLILDHVPAYVLFKDTQGKILRVNQTVADSLGLEIAEVEGRETAELYPDHADTFQKEDLEVLGTKKPKYGMVDYLNADLRGWRWIRTDKIPIIDAQGEVDRLLVVSIDITKIKETEDSLRESQARLAASHEQLEEKVWEKTAELAESQARYEDLYQNAPDMHVSVSPDTGCILRCNQTLLNETGYSLEEVLGRPIFDLYHPASLERAKATMKLFRTTGSVRNHELTLARKDGSRIEVSLNVSSLRDADGNILASRSVWRDITDKKRLEQEAKSHLDQLAHLSRVAMMNEMATGIAHELNQPLHAIKNFAEGALIRMNNDSFERSTLTTVFKDIVGNADRAAELIAHFREFAKPSGKQAEAISPLELVERLLKLIAREMQQLESSVTVKLEENLPQVTCDSVQIQQVLINLILNAAEASADNGAAEEIELVAEKTDQQTVRFAVVDQGRGLSEVDAERIFDAFYTTKESGMGLGLPICKTIVEAHGGRLLAEANAGPGLTMAFELPITDA